MGGPPILSGYQSINRYKISPRSELVYANTHGCSLVQINEHKALIMFVNQLKQSLLRRILSRNPDSKALERFLIYALRFF